MDPTPFLVGFVVMSLASLAIQFKGSKAPAIRHHTYLHATVPFIAATAYLAMLFGIGDVLKLDGTVTFVARYADWAVTTPILLTGLVLAGLHERGKPAGFLVAIITLDVLMIVTGLIASLAILPAMKLVWFLWSCAAFVGVLGILWGPIRRISGEEGGAFDTAFRRNLTFLTIVWFLYPVVFAIGPEGLYLIPTNASTWAILVLDVLAKVVYGFTAGSNVERAAQSRTTFEDRG